MNTIYVAAGDPQAGPIGLAIVVVLGVVIAFLGKSMTRHLSKLPESFEKKPDAPAMDAAMDAAGTDHAGTDNAPAGTNAAGTNAAGTDDAPAAALPGQPADGGTPR